MAIASMQKVMVVAHRSQATNLLELLQKAGIVQILDAERAMISKAWPELMVESRRHRDLEESIEQYEKAIGFLKPYIGKEPTSIFQPKVPIESDKYQNVISEQKADELLKRTESIVGKMEYLQAERDGLESLLQRLMPWQPLDTPLEELNSLTRSTVFTGLVPEQFMGEAEAKLSEQDAAVSQVNHADRLHSVIVVCLNEHAADVHKILRSVDFEIISFEGLTGTAQENITDIQSRLNEIDDEIEKQKKYAAEVAAERITLQIMCDHLRNLLERIQTESVVPATDHTVFFEGWVKKQDYPTLEKLVSGFDACDIAPIESADEEAPPVDINNGPASRPFETITRLYGIPSHKDVDPTVFLAPFFALFFGLCLTDAGYGIVLTLLLAWAVKKIQGDKKAIIMLLICSVMTIIAGAITGGWFADTIQTLLPQDEGSFGASLETLRQKLMLFDPMSQPLVFIGISLALGYIQVLFGLLIGFFNLLRQKQYASAIYEKLTWVIMLNCLLLFALVKQGLLPGWLSGPSWITAVVMVGLIFWCTERNSGMAGRIGGGVFAVFSTVFYLGDMLSYVRIMALGMVTAGLGMAVNILTQLVMDVPYVGFILGLLLFVFGHTVNIALSLLSAFVHSLRLQFVEFFPKFFEGGGREFKPLQNIYEYVTIVKNKNP